MNGKAWRAAALAVVGAVIVTLASGCAWSIGGHKDPAVSAQPTKGQELMDLKKARDQGAITEDEYQAQKKRVMDK